MNWNSFKTAMEAVGIGGTLVVTSLSLWLNTQTQRNLEMIQEKQREASHALESLKHSDEYSLSVYKEVVSALKERNERMERVATALVEAMPPESSLRASLLQAIQVGAQSTEAQDEARFLAGEQPIAQVPTPAGTPRSESWNVDIFYCDNEPMGEQHANAVADTLRRETLAGANAVGGIRVRKLPKVVNDRVGYRAEGVQIRYEPSEQEAARSLQEKISPPLAQVYGQDITPQLVRVGSSTPEYLSIFLCPAHKQGQG